MTGHRLFRVDRTLATLLVFCLFPISTGCSGSNNRTVRQARVAEEQGEAHVAYDAYCNAAKKDPGDIRVAAGIKRLAPTAATYWESQSRIAASEGRFADAWRMAIRSLEIRPDQPGMAAFVRQIESEHPDAVASARRNGPSPTETTLASANRSTVSDESDETDKPDEPPARPESSRRKAERDRRSKSNRESRRSKFPDATDENAAPSTGANGPANVSGPENAGFAVLYTLSRDDEHYPARVRLTDGIYMKLRDVDEDRTADVDLDNGDDRVQKIRGMRIGQSKLFRGRSGRWFRFSLLDVNYRTETIRIGLRPG